MNEPFVAYAPSTPSACFRGTQCTWVGPGHSLAFGQGEIAAAYPEAWRDAVVETVSAGGWIMLTTIDNADRMLAWNHSDVLAALAPGDPVSVSADFHVLATGDTHFNVMLV